ncbi:phage scaffolding protein [Streptococcus suis]|uniref:phage scaffolding protein n=1 Tax=Streptococcus suis TaxID=1307 RepID=UPI001E473266|nr:phage scaffolding protein [Streptococcus suis]MCB2859551.1 phage scaffolding protein [Streptococcus suis]MCB2868087.1 phage scaffolding protein [Streptococcus suis]MCO8213031.1 phage scaffolding protein [Streptococcus suis]HEM3437923.1 phage scaffolding protein [Streptococcus suis]
MKREFLAGLGLSDEVIEQVMAEHGKTVQATQSKLDEAESKLKEANSTLDTLKKSNKDNEELQKELKTYKEKVSQLEADAKETAKKQSIKDALVNAKATDVDYLMYKLGDVELAEDGSIKDLDNKIKDLQTNHPTFFQVTEQEQPGNGFKSLGGVDLPSGQRSTIYTQEDIARMTPEQINSNWDAIKSSLENGGTN